MRKSSLEITFEKFFGQISFYRDLLTKIKHTDKISYDNPEVIKSLKRTNIDLREKKAVFEAFLLKIHVTWEILVEDLLIDCLSRDISQYAKHKEATFPKHLPRNVCKALITGLGYFDVRSVGDIQKIARQIRLANYINAFINAAVAMAKFLGVQPAKGGAK